jgi:O-antigen ligase
MGKAFWEKINKIVTRFKPQSKDDAVVGLFFIFFVPLLFVGDGKQSPIDIYGSFVILILAVVSRFYLKKIRIFPDRDGWLWGLMLGYFAVRTVFSDDVGYSIYATARYLDAFIVFYIFRVYSTKKTAKTFMLFLLGFSVFVLGSAMIFNVIPSLSDKIPKMNLLYPTYGHNHVVDILVFAYPAALAVWLIARGRKYLCLASLFVLGIFLSQSRAATVMAAASSLCAGLYFHRLRLITLRNRKVFLIVLMSVLICGFWLVGHNRLTDSLHQVFVLRKTAEKPKLTEDARFEYWRQALLSVKQNPFYGSGPGTFSLNSKKYQSNKDYNSWFAHNFILEQTSEVGIIGIVLIMFLVMSVFKPRFFQDRKIDNRTDVFLLGLKAALISGIIYSLVDYGFNYLIVWLLFWAGAGVVSAAGDDTVGRKSELPVTNLLFAVSVFGVTGFYYFLVTSTIFPGSNLNIITASGTVRRLNEKVFNPENTAIIRFLHRKNPEVLAALGDFYGAYQNEPQNVRYANKYASGLINSGNDSDFKKFLVELGQRDLNPDMLSALNMIKSAPVSAPVIFKDQIQDIKDTASIREYTAIIYYLTGLSVIKSRPDLTGEFWYLSTKFAPQWSYFHIEYAVYLKYLKNQPDHARRILVECQSYSSPKTHCADVLNDTLPAPGSFVKQIIMIPEKIQSPAGI